MRVQILDCLNVEGFEEFAFNLSSAVNGVIARASSRVSIVDNDNIVATPKLFVRDAVVDEKDGNALVSVLLGGTGGQASNSTVSVDYATADGTANGGADYTASPARSASLPARRRRRSWSRSPTTAPQKARRASCSTSATRATPRSPPAQGRSRSAPATPPDSTDPDIRARPIWSSVRRTGSSTCRSLCPRRA